MRAWACGLFSRAEVGLWAFALSDLDGCRCFFESTADKGGVCLAIKDLAKKILSGWAGHSSRGCEVRLTRNLAIGRLHTEKREADGPH